MVKVGTNSVCVVHGHAQKSGRDKPKGTPIKCYPFSGPGGRAGAIKKAYAMHTAISKNEKFSKLTDLIAEAEELLEKKKKRKEGAWPLMSEPSR